MHIRFFAKMAETATQHVDLSVVNQMARTVLDSGATNGSHPDVSNDDHDNWDWNSFGIALGVTVGIFAIALLTKCAVKKCRQSEASLPPVDEAESNYNRF